MKKPEAYQRDTNSAASYPQDDVSRRIHATKCGGLKEKLTHSSRKLLMKKTHEEPKTANKTPCHSRNLSGEAPGLDPGA